jgi:protein involved in polysaccharide export with SLBB domain
MKTINGLALILAVGGLTLAGLGSAGAQTPSVSWPAGPVPQGEQGSEEERLSGSRTDVGSALELRRTPVPLGQAGPVDPETYRLGPGDLLQLDLWGRLIRTMPLEVSPEGRIFLPGLGPVEVAGRSLAWTRAHILALVAETFRGVKADLRLLRLRTFKVYLTGRVNRPGAIEVNPATRASEAVDRVGVADGGSRRDIEVRRRDGPALRLDLLRIQATGRLDLDPLLSDGDVIHVPAATDFVEVQGGVAVPGRYELGPGDSLMTLVEIAGGFLPASAVQGALLVRFKSASARESLWVSLDEVASGANNPALRDGDRFYVFLTPDYHVVPQVAIYGEVERPGTYPIVLGRDRLSDLVYWAGGFLPLADRSALHLLRYSESHDEKDPELDRLVTLSRPDMTESEYAVLQTKLAERKNSFRVDWARVQREGKDLDPLLRDGDVLRVDRLVTSVRIEGEVRRPGYVDYVFGRTLREYVELAGGFTDRAARGSVRVSRYLTGQIVPAKSLKNVQPGDFIWVPDRKDVDFWPIFRDVVTVAGQIAVIVVAVRR